MQNTCYCINFSHPTCETFQLTCCLDTLPKLPLVCRWKCNHSTASWPPKHSSYTRILTRFFRRGMPERKLVIISRHYRDESQKHTIFLQQCIFYFSLQHATEQGPDIIFICDTLTSCVALKGAFCTCPSPVARPDAEVQRAIVENLLVT